jgi:HSP20 family protein
MPGVSKECLQIDLDANELRITSRRPAAGPSSGSYLVRERSRGFFYQAYTLDNTIDHGKIDAVLEAGVLTLTLHRKDAEKPRRIQVKS